VLNSIDQDTPEENIYRIFAASRMMLIEENVFERLGKLIYYLYRRGNIPAEKITQQLAAVSKSLEEEAMNAAEELIERGRREAMIAAENQVLESAQALLLKQLERKFRALTKQEQETIQSCHDQARFEAASLALIDGKSKDEVLAELR